MRADSSGPGLSTLPAKPKRRVGRHEEQRLKERLRKSAPSEPWVEAQIKAIEDVTEDGTAIIYRYHDPCVFPPGGQQTAMVRCPKCGVFTPPNTIEHGACLDHACHDGWGPSPSAVAITKAAQRKLRNTQLELLPEDTRSLRNEIAAWLESGRTSLSGL
jgi:hypothetical protein